PAVVTKITGITQDQLLGKPRFVEVADGWQEFTQKADVVVAHNLSYDIAVTQFEYQRLERSISWPERKVCTVEATEWVKGYRLSLTNLHIELFGEAFDSAHSAENDVRAMGRCYVELHNRGWL